MEVAYRQQDWSDADHDVADGHEDEDVDVDEDEDEEVPGQVVADSVG